jgi:hypothetical protein
VDNVARERGKICDRATWGHREDGIIVLVDEQKTGDGGPSLTSLAVRPAVTLPRPLVRP